MKAPQGIPVGKVSLPCLHRLRSFRRQRFLTFHRWSHNRDVPVVLRIRISPVQHDQFAAIGPRLRFL